MDTGPYSTLLAETKTAARVLFVVSCVGIPMIGVCVTLLAMGAISFTYFAILATLLFGVMAICGVRVLVKLTALIDVTATLHALTLGSGDGLRSTEV